MRYNLKVVHVVWSMLSFLYIDFAEKQCKNIEHSGIMANNVDSTVKESMQVLPLVLAFSYHLYFSLCRGQPWLTSSFLKLCMNSRHTFGDYREPPEEGGKGWKMPVLPFGIVYS